MKALEVKEYLEENRESVKKVLETLLVVESWGVKYSIRFEPRFFGKLQISKERKALIRKVRKYMEGYVSRNTSLVLLSCSYGYFQILGYNFLRLFEKYGIESRKFHIDVYRESLQCLYLIDFLKRNKINVENVIRAMEERKFTRDMYIFALRYNGSFSYIEKLQKAFRILREMDRDEKERFENLSEFLVSEAFSYIDEMQKKGVDK